MSIFNLKNHQVIVEPDKLIIPEFRYLWERDKSKNKEQATKELSYVYFATDYQSPYNVYPEDVRINKITEDFIKDPSWIPDEHIMAAVSKYRRFQETPSIRLLRGAQMGANKLEEYFRESDPSDPKFTSNLEKIGKIVESLDKLEEKVKKDTTKSDKIRGGGTIGGREN